MWPMTTELGLKTSTKHRNLSLNNISEFILHSEKSFFTKTNK